MLNGFVSSDGSPLAMYLALPAGNEPCIIHEALPGVGSILELGSGPGRLTRVLAAFGHTVVAVDDSAEMLAHVTGAETVCADLFDLDLGRTFDGVVAASHLINRADSRERLALLDVCSRHVTAEGSVLVQRYPPGWPPKAETISSVAGPVSISFTRLSQDGDVVSGAVTYTLGSSSWEQRFDAVDIDDAALASAASEANLEVVEVITDDETWVRLRPSN